MRFLLFFQKIIKRMELITYDPLSSARRFVEELFSFSESERARACAKAMDMFNHKHGCPGKGYIPMSREQIYNYERNLRLASELERLSALQSQS